MRDAVPRFNGGREILPTNLKPTHYYLVVEPDFEKAEEYEGSVVIDLDVVEETSLISLNATADLKILKTQVILGGKKIQISGTNYDASRQTLTIELEEKLKMGGKAMLVVKFKGSHVHNSHGFFRSPFTDRDGEAKV